MSGVLRTRTFSKMLRCVLDDMGSDCGLNSIQQILLAEDRLEGSRGCQSSLLLFVLS